jgi:hydrogenase/urease accessory protein HupE
VTEPRIRAAVPAAAATLLAAASPALAHGIDIGERDTSVLGFVPLGFEHMALGWDHLLFILGVVLLAGTLGRAAKLISLFVAGHSLTLIVATLTGWQVDATAVDVVIALSVVFVAVLGIFGRPDDWRLVGLAVFGFGLVHGLGLSTRLQALGLPDDGLLPRVIAFNVGIELGQLAAIALMVVVIRLAVRLVPAWPAVRDYAYALLVTVGLVAATLLAVGVTGSDATIASRSCAELTNDPPGAVDGQHPDKRFYRPGDRFDGADLVHVIGDGFVVVRYRPDIPGADREALASWIARSEKAVIAAPDDDQDETIRAYAATRTAICAQVDTGALQDFSERWFAALRVEREG